MANEVEKVALVAVGSIEKIDLITVANMEKISGMEISAGSSHTWSSAGAMNDSMSGAGGHAIGLVNTAVVVAGGYEGAFTDDTQERNGTTWTTESATISATRQEAGMGGSSTSGLIFGGWPGAGGNTNVTEEYGGSSWSSGGNIPTAKGANRGCGTSQTDMLEATGNVDGGSGVTSGKTASTYNGSSWSSITAPSNTGQYVGSFGEADAGYFCGGVGYPSAMNAVQSWDGSSWTTGSVTLRIYQFQQGFSFGSSSDAVLGGGAGATTSSDSYADNQDHADKWDGSAFSATSTVPYGKNDCMGAGVVTGGTCFGGGGGSHVDTCVTYA
jgi:hypothetical protein